MLAAKLEDPSRLKFPVLVTPKIDGIRCVITDEGPRTRSLKEIPNRHIMHQLSTLPKWLDGELTVGDKFFDCTSGIMTESGEPNFIYWVFDRVDFYRSDQLRPYFSRAGHLLTLTLPSFCRILTPEIAANMHELTQLYDKWLLRGAEGICFRTPDSPYKNGRSTFREQYLVKWKQFLTEEAFIIDCVELMHNDNAPEINALGLTERSSHQSNLRPSGTLGALRVRNHLWSQDFYIGTGFDAATRQHLWNHRESIKGRLVRYKYHAYGCKDAPRSPVFEGFRSIFDL